MEYSEEQLEQVEKLASIYMKISDIALIIEVDEDELRSDIAAQITEVPSSELEACLFGIIGGRYASVVVR